MEIYDFLTPHRPAGSTTPRLLRSFQLPLLSADAIVASILTRSDPSPQCSVQRSKANAKPFHTAPTSRLLTISIDIFRQMEDFRTFVLFVHHSALLDGLELEPHPKMIVPWEEWGPRKSRMLPTLYNEPTWVCYVHGTRYVRLESVVGEPFGLGGRSHLRMLDFNPLVLKRGAFSFLGPKRFHLNVFRVQRLAFRKSTSTPCGCWVRGVVRNLPCHATDRHSC